MNKAESKYYNTARKIDEAFLEILDKKEFEYITVKEICEKAKVNRSTFYLHYETVNDLLLETVEYINSKVLAYFEHIKYDFEDIKTFSIDRLNFIKPEFITPWLLFIKENKQLYKTIIKRYYTLNMNEKYLTLLEQLVFPVLERYGVDDENKMYVFLFYIEGINAIVKEWIKQDCKKDIAEIEKIILNCVNRV